jgi:hypothetical protein
MKCSECGWESERTRRSDVEEIVHLYKLYHLVYRKPTIAELKGMKPKLK